MRYNWREGNKIQLLRNDGQYHPAVFRATDEAQKHIILETFIWFEDDVNKQLHVALLVAAQRGVKAEVSLDDYDSSDLSDGFVNELTAAGVIFRYYDPRPCLFGICTNVFHRMCHKIVVIDTRIALTDGPSYSAEHMSSYDSEAKRDYAVCLEGLIVGDILQPGLKNLPGQSTTRCWWRRHRKMEENRQSRETQVLLVWRDNKGHHDNTERHYLKVLTQARREAVIASTHFFLGYRLLHALRKTARHGARIRLIIQDESSIPIVRVSVRLLYNYSIKGGVQVFEYRRRSFHGRVALMDDHWATVGSSNLDPLSLSLNLRANVIVHDHNFNQTLRDNLNGIIVTDCRQANEVMLPKRTWWDLTKSILAFRFLHHFPVLVGWLPAHTPRLAWVSPPA